jgi:hypothetical protein
VSYATIVRYLSIALTWAVLVDDAEGQAARAQGHVFCWPTPLPVSTDTPWESFVQPTASGKPASGLFGNTRSGDTQFHEGLDIRPAKRDKQGEPTDTVQCVLAGRVVHIAPVPNGTYGRYVVLEHTEPGLRFYTLHAHLQRVAPTLRLGATVPAGTSLGIMGRSDNTRGFPKERAHLHFEVGLRLSSDFNAWYARQGYPEPNHHGNWNGYNLLGLDPLPFLRTGLSLGRPPSLATMLRNEPTAVAVFISTNQTPRFIRENTALLTQRLPARIAGWRIGFTWYGLPHRWTPLSSPPTQGTGQRAMRLVATSDPTLLRKAQIRNLLARTPQKARKTQALAPGDSLSNTLGMLFPPTPR